MTAPLSELQRLGQEFDKDTATPRCRACGETVCDHPDAIYAGLAPAPIPTGTNAGRAVHPATSGRIPAAGNSHPSGRTVGAAGHGLSDRPGCNSDHFPFHEVCNNDRA